MQKWFCSCESKHCWLQKVGHFSKAKLCFIKMNIQNKISTNTKFSYKQVNTKKIGNIGLSK